MTHMLEDESGIYTAVINAEEQYSIWPVNRELPAGWTRVGSAGSRAAVLTFINSTWLDMRPRTLREAMSGQ